jgi:hypothetical protein
LIRNVEHYNLPVVQKCYRRFLPVVIIALRFSEAKTGREKHTPSAKAHSEPVANREKRKGNLLMLSMKVS